MNVRRRAAGLGALLRTLPGGEEREIVDQLLDFALAAADPGERGVGRRRRRRWGSGNGPVVGARGLRRRAIDIAGCCCVLAVHDVPRSGVCGHCRKPGRRTEGVLSIGGNNCRNLEERLAPDVR